MVVGVSCKPVCFLNYHSINGLVLLASGNQILQSRPVEVSGTLSIVNIDSSYFMATAFGKSPAKNFLSSEGIVVFCLFLCGYAAINSFAMKLARAHFNAPINLVKFTRHYKLPAVN